MSKAQRMEAFRLGERAGKASGSWVLNGNSTAEDAQAILRGVETGDPAIMDLEPSPLSGEWADSPTPLTLAAELEIEDEAEIDEACDSYEAGFSDGFWEEVIRSAKVYA